MLNIVIYTFKVNKPLDRELKLNVQNIFRLHPPVFRENTNTRTNLMENLIQISCVKISYY